MSRRNYVFISYASDDSDPALALKGRLRESNINAYVDSSEIRSGDEWRLAIEEALKSAFALIVVCTNRSMESKEVLFEWAYAMGRHIPVIPLIYEKGCVLHSRLQILQHLDFTNPRNRQWDKLVSDLNEANDQYGLTVEYLKKAGILRIAFSRDELGSEYSVSKILDQVKPHSELFVVARSCEAWARQYLDLQNALNGKSLTVKLAMVDPDIPREQWMIKSDYAQLDVDATLGKLRMIALEPNSSGSIKLFCLPSSPLFSFVHFVNQDDSQRGLLEAGASLSLNERTIFVLGPGDAFEGVMLERFYRMHLRMLDGLTPIFTLPEIKDVELKG